MKTLKLAALFAGLALLPMANAHDDNWLDQQTAPNGGQLRMAGLYHLERVVKGDQLDLFLTDHADNKQTAEGASAQVTLLADKKVQKVDLKPAGDNRLSAKGKFPTSADLQAVVVLTPGKGDKVQAKFTPFKKAKASDHHQHDHSHEKPEHSHSHDHDHQH